MRLNLGPKWGKHVQTALKECLDELQSNGWLQVVELDRLIQERAATRSTRKKL